MWLLCREESKPGCGLGFTENQRNSNVADEVISKPNPNRSSSSAFTSTVQWQLTSRSVSSSLYYLGKTGGPTFSSNPLTAITGKIRLWP